MPKAPKVSVPTVTYTWVIKSIYTLPNDTVGQFVVNVMFTVTGTDGTNTASIDGNSRFDFDSGKTYTAFDQLTEAQVITWAQDKIGENGVTSLQACIDGQIDSIVNPPVSPSAAAFPWASA